MNSLPCLPVLLAGLVLSAPAQALTVAVSVPPQVSIVEQLGAGVAEVFAVLPPGADHETWSPRPSEVARPRAAATYCATGFGFERLLLPRLRAGQQDLAVIEPASDHAHHHDHAHDHHHDHDHGHAHDELHRWLDPRLVRADAARLAAAMAAARPAEAAAIRRAEVAFAEQCKALEAELAARLAPYEGRRFYVYHAAFGAFADAFGLEQVALEREGREPSLRDLEELIAAARREGVKVIYVQPQHRPAAAQQLARAIGAELVILDPLAADWANNLRHLAATLAAGFAETEVVDPS